MQPGDSLAAEREVLLKDLGLLKLEYNRLEPSSVEAIAIGTAIAVPRIALSTLQREILNNRHNK